MKSWDRINVIYFISDCLLNADQELRWTEGGCRTSQHSGSLGNCNNKLRTEKTLSVFNHWSVFFCLDCTSISCPFVCLLLTIARFCISLVLSSSYEEKRRIRHFYSSLMKGYEEYVAKYVRNQSWNNVYCSGCRMSEYSGLGLGLGQSDDVRVLVSWNGWVGMIAGSSERRKLFTVHSSKHDNNLPPSGNQRWIYHTHSPSAGWIFIIAGLQLSCRILI